MITFEQAAADLQRVGRLAPDLVEDELRTTASAAAQQLRNVWPRDTGESGDAWEADGSAVVNDAPHTEHVHNRLADRLVPEVLEDLEPETIERIDRAIRDAANWEM